MKKATAYRYGVAYLIPFRAQKSPHLAGFVVWFVWAIYQPKS